MSCYAFRLAPCDLGDPGWGDPWFPHGAVLLPSPACMALCVFFPSNAAFMALARSFNMFYCMLQDGSMALCVFVFSLFFGNFCGHTIMR